MQMTTEQTNNSNFALFRYDIMLSCWRVNPETRPMFNELERSLFKLLDTNVAEYYVRLNEPYVKANVEKFEHGMTDYIALMGTPKSRAPSIPCPRSPPSAPSLEGNRIVTIAEVHQPPRELSMDDIDP